MNDTQYMRPITAEERWKSVTDISRLDHSFSDSDNQGEAYRICLAYARQFPAMLEEHIGIRLHGEVGTGKTFYASCIGSYIRQMGYQVAWIDFRSFIDEMADYRERNADYIGRIMTSQVLIIDDLDTRKLNSMEQSCMFRLINARQSYVNIITTNMTPSAVSNGETVDMDEKRALSRIQAMCPVAIVLNGKDRRKDVATERRKLAQEIMQGGMD